MEPSRVERRPLAALGAFAAIALAVVMIVGVPRIIDQGAPGTTTVAGVVLPTLAGDWSACYEVGLDATLAGTPDDPRVTWLNTTAGGRQEITWPAGFTARFAPDLEVLDPTGRVVFRAGDRVRSACVVGPANDPGKFLLLRPGS